MRKAEAEARVLKLVQEPRGKKKKKTRTEVESLERMRLEKGK